MSKFIPRKSSSRAYETGEVTERVRQREREREKERSRMVFRGDGRRKDRV